MAQGKARSPSVSSNGSGRAAAPVAIKADPSASFRRWLTLTLVCRGQCFDGYTGMQMNIVFLPPVRGNTDCNCGESSSNMDFESGGVHKEDVAHRKTDAAHR